MNTAFELKDVFAERGKTTVLKNISQIIPQNKIISLIGANGAGKTTLLRLLAGLEKPVSGTLSVLQKDSISLTRKEFSRYVSYIPQEHRSVFAYTVRDFVVMGRNPYQSEIKAPSKEDWEFTDYVLEKLRLKDFAERSYTQLSSGEARLILLARGLVQNAPIMLLDEPTSNLDFYNEHKLMEIICKLCKEEKKSIIVSIHNPALAIQYSDIVYCIHQNTIFETVEKSDNSFDKKIIELLNLIYKKDEASQIHLKYVDDKPFVYIKPHF